MNATARKRTGASLNRGGSKQNYATPWDFIRAVERRYGPIAVDLAATHDNAKAETYYTPDDNALVQPWARIEGVHPEALRWLNPPFSRIGPWAAKCLAEARLGCRIAFLVPAAVDAVWFLESVHRRALVRPLLPRITFVGEEHGYPKGLMLCMYGETPGFAPWRWKEKKMRTKKGARHG